MKINITILYLTIISIYGYAVDYISGGMGVGSVRYPQNGIFTNQSVNHISAGLGFKIHQNADTTTRLTVLAQGYTTASTLYLMDTGIKVFIIKSIFPKHYVSFGGVVTYALSMSDRMDRLSSVGLGISMGYRYAVSTQLAVTIDACSHYYPRVFRDSWNMTARSLTMGVTWDILP